MNKKDYFKIPDDCEIAEIKKIIKNFSATLQKLDERIEILELNKIETRKRKEAIRIDYVRNQDFYDDNHFLYKYIDTKNNWTIGYYRPEKCYDRTGQEITREELEAMLKKIDN